MTEDHRSTVEALVASHAHLVEITNGLSDAALTGPSYCSEWNVAQVLSHLGSGAEIARLMLTAALSHEPAPPRDLYEPIWDRWNALSDGEKKTAAIASDTAYVDALTSASDEDLSSVQIDAFGRELDAQAMVGMRLGEHVVHTWDIEVIEDDDATLFSKTTGVLVDRMPANAARLARGERPKAKARLSIKTTGDDRDFVLDLSGNDPVLTVGKADAEGEFVMPSESLVRLVYGRLDKEHTPSAISSTGPVNLDELRALFPGF